MVLSPKLPEMMPHKQNGCVVWTHQKCHIKSAWYCIFYRTRYNYPIEKLSIVNNSWYKLCQFLRQFIYLYRFRKKHILRVYCKVKFPVWFLAVKNEKNKIINYGYVANITKNWSGLYISGYFHLVLSTRICPIICKILFNLFYFWNR